MYDRYLKDADTLAWTLVETLKARVMALKAAEGESGGGVDVVDVEIGAAAGGLV